MTFILSILLVFGMFVSGISQAHAARLKSVWQGNWETTYGQLRLKQIGTRVFGDYHVRGVIEGRISADGKSLRGVFTYNGNKWGTFDFRLTTNASGHPEDISNFDRFDGHWRLAGVTQVGDKVWSGERSRSEPGQLIFGGSDVDNSLVQMVKANNGVTHVSSTGSNSGAVEDAVERFVDFTDIQWPKSLPNAASAGNLQHDGPAQAVGGNVDFGPWYGGYELTNLGPDFELIANVDQIGDGGSGSVELLLKPFISDIDPDTQSNRQCPQNMHPDFCAELYYHAGRKAVALKVVGVMMEKDFPRSMYVALEMPDHASGKKTLRIMRLVRESNAILVTIVHPERGVDYIGGARISAHRCERESCSAQRLALLRKNPQAGLGVFADKTLFNQDQTQSDNRSNERWQQEKTVALLQ